MHAGYLAQLSSLMELVEHSGSPTESQLQCGSSAPMAKNLDEGFSVCQVSCGCVSRGSNGATAGVGSVSDGNCPLCGQWQYV